MRCYTPSHLRQWQPFTASMHSTQALARTELVTRVFKKCTGVLQGAPAKASLRLVRRSLDGSGAVGCHALHLLALPPLLQLRHQPLQELHTSTQAPTEPRGASCLTHRCALPNGNR